MQPSTVEELSAEQRREIAAWIDAHQAELPDAVRIFLGLHQRYLNAQGNLKKSFEAALRELRRALHIIPSSEKQRRSGSPLAGLPPKDAASAKSAREEIEQQIARMNRLAGWHQDLQERHDRRSKRLLEKLAKMTIEKVDDAQRKRAHEPERLEDIELELSPEKIAENQAANQRFVEYMLSGDGADPAMASVNETLMPGGTVLERDELEHLPAEIPAELTEAQVLKTLNEKRVRYDFAVSVTRIELDVEKKVILDRDGQRRVIAASTRDFGPPRYGVTWQALATLAILVGQYAMPFNRLGSLFSTSAKRFTAGALSRMLHYVARRFLPIYLELATDLANSEILAGDDTSCRVLEVSTHFAQSGSSPEKKPAQPPWADYATPRIAEESFA
ncbi:MAG TPA: transposase, partial [Polyangiaceae bacterium]|nr:transposase [Polyangiaceae bacterium]